MNTHNTWHLHTIQKSDLLKTGESHFSLVRVMELLVKEIFFPENFNLPNLIDIQR